MDISSRHQPGENQSDDESNNDEGSESNEPESNNVSRQKTLKKLIDDQHDHRPIMDLSCQGLIDDDMEIIIEYAIRRKKCQGLNLWGNRFTWKGASRLADVFKKGNRTLLELDLAHNRLSDKGVQILSEVLATNPCVIGDIDLSSNGITNEGADYLADMLKKNTKIRRLTLNKNKITDHGLESLAKALVHDNKKLRDLRLEENELITHKGVDNIITLLQDNKTLKNINVRGCDISKDDQVSLETMAVETVKFNVFVRYSIPDE